MEPTCRKICVIDTPIDEPEKPQQICWGGTKINLRKFRSLLTKKESVNAFLVSRLIDLLAKYPQTGRVGFYARAYPDYGLLTVGFTEPTGEWDPVINFHFLELITASDEELFAEITEKFGAY